MKRKIGIEQYFPLEILAIWKHCVIIPKSCRLYYSFILIPKSLFLEIHTIQLFQYSLIIITVISYLHVTLVYSLRTVAPSSLSLSSHFPATLPEEFHIPKMTPANILLSW